MKLTLLFSKEDFLIFTEKVNSLLSSKDFNTKEQLLLYLVKNNDV